ncbi:MAG: YSC84-related protein [Steroidobacteraceae bacterium]
MNRPTIVRLHALLIALALIYLPLGTAQAKKGAEIDAEVDAALQVFKQKVKGAEEYLKGSKGVLVMPGIKKVGFVVGAQWGEGALRIANKTADYYKMNVGSVGFQAGYQDANFVFLFLTQAALDNFRASGGWGTGVETGITIVDASTPALTLDTLKSKASVVGFAFGQSGLMAGWSAKGSKFTKIKG